MGFILEHVVDPEFIINKYKGYLKKNGIMFVAVPNAKSFHRLLGFHANLLEDIHQLGKGDLDFGHKRYYDLESISELISKVGLKIKTLKGIYFKPFTTQQIKTLKLTKEVIDAMMIVGESIPEYCNSLYIEVIKGN
jgi:2-polyprenyl-3-methyl-5-hydroxy-6-metoxy-1,4-benzoquinol methylase